MEKLQRKIKVGKTLNIQIDVQGNLTNDIISASATSENGKVSFGSFDVGNNPITAPITGVAVGQDIVTVNYSSSDESDCQKFIVEVEDC